MSFDTTRDCTVDLVGVESGRSLRGQRGRLGSRWMRFCAGCVHRASWQPWWILFGAAVLWLWPSVSFADIAPEPTGWDASGATPLAAFLLGAFLAVLMTWLVRRFVRRGNQRG